MSNIINKYYQDVLKNKSDKKEFLNSLKKWQSVTDIEQEVCDFYFDRTKKLHINLANEWGEGAFRKEKKLLEDMLKIRCLKMDNNFTWIENYKKQLLELNEKIMNGFSIAYKEAETQFNIFKERMKCNDPYFKGYKIDIKLTPVILEPNENDSHLEEREEGIYNLLYNMLPDTLWTDSLVYNEHDNNIIKPRRYRNDEENFNKKKYFGKKNFDNSFICCAMYDLLCNSKKILSWYDILKINEIRVEVKVTYQNLINNIGKGTFWDNGIQSLSDNEAENIRQEYLCWLDKRMSGFLVEMAVDEMNCWEKIGPFRRIKFQGNKEEFDYKKIYSMSIEENPRVLVKDAQIDLTDEELQQVKDYVSKNRKLLIRMAEGKICFIDYCRKLGYMEKRRKK